ncbi:MAG: hypothetical protein KDA67_02245, partial [Rhodobacteraceae bacterium]|nr:hypothetical protein [Paracoccaceae bacterium]
AGGKVEQYVYTKEGSPVRLRMPANAGEYEIRYVQDQGKKVLASQNVSVTAVAASLSHAATARAGEPLLIEWQGPDYPRDFIAVARVGDKPGVYVQYVRTNEGSPTRLVMPLQTGSYEIRYVQDQGKKVLATSPIEVAAVEASLSVATIAKVGEALLVEWSGPDYARDYISIARVGDKDTAYLGYTRTSDGSPLRLPMPGEPGNYQIRYMAKGSPDTKLASADITLEPVEASVSGPIKAAPGAEILVNWSGPDYPRDYVAIGLKGDKRQLIYKRTSEGSPLRLRLPDRPGLYELRYVLKAGDTVVARQDLTVE